MVNSRPKLAPSSPSAAAASAPPGAALRTDSVLPLEHGRTAARVRSANLNTGARTVGRTRTWVRRAHGLVGVISALNLLLLIITGFLLQHREMFRLDERMLSRKILPYIYRAEEHTSELQSPCNLVCRLLLEKKKKKHQMKIVL